MVIPPLSKESPTINTVRSGIIKANECLSFLCCYNILTLICILNVIFYSLFHQYI